MEQLGGIDSAFLFCETPTMHMHICGLLILDTSTIAEEDCFERIRSMVVGRLEVMPALRHKLANVPLNLGRPFWVDDEDFDIENHIFRTRLAAPGDERALAETVGEIASRPLNRHRPLWEMWVVEGLRDERVALVVKMHHSTIDGVSGANLMGHFFDLDPTTSPPAVAAAPLRTHRAPSTVALLSRALRQRLTEPADILRLVPETAYRLGTSLLQMARTGDTQTPMAKPFTAPRTSFNASVSAERCVAFVDVSLADVKAVKSAFGVTVNDVVTAVVGGALRRYLEDRGELPDKSLIAAEPVSVHEQTRDTDGVTKVSVMFATLATNIDDPEDRLRAIAAANLKAKEFHRLVGADTLLEWADHFWLNAFSLGSRLYCGLHVADHLPVVHNLILSNVPGPPCPLYLAGARLAGVYPLGPIMDGAGLNVTVLSQEDRIGFGIIACPRLVANVWELADAMPESLAELVKRTTPAADGRATHRRTTSHSVPASA